MKKLICFTIFFLFYNCKKNNNKIHVIGIQKQGNLLVMDIENNSRQDYYILNPTLEVYIDGGAYMIKTVLISPYLKSVRTDSLICKVFANDCILNEKFFSQVVKVPKNNVTKLKYTYSYDFDENEVEYIPVFPYNIDQRQQNSTKTKNYQLQKKLNDNNILKGYKLYIDEIK